MKLQSKKQHTLNNSSQQQHRRKDFDSVIEDTTRDMSSSRRHFSRFIHSRLIWSTGNILSQTIARPNALLFGAVLAFAVTIGVYLLSKNFGYSLSGSESIGAFLVGWTAGIIFDIFSALFKEKK